jgi:hypothetical protein
VTPAQRPEAASCDHPSAADACALDDGKAFIQVVQNLSSVAIPRETALIEAVFLQRLHCAIHDRRELAFGHKPPFCDWLLSCFIPHTHRMQRRET